VFVESFRSHTSDYLLPLNDKSVEKADKLIIMFYVIKLAFRRELRQERKHFFSSAQQMLAEEIYEVIAFLCLSGKGVELPELHIDYRFEEVPAGRFLAP